MAEAATAAVIFLFIIFILAFINVLIIFGVLLNEFVCKIKYFDTVLKIFPFIGLIYLLIIWIIIF